jgi:hypothetical protein
MRIKGNNRGVHTAAWLKLINQPVEAFFLSPAVINMMRAASSLLEL